MKERVSVISEEDRQGPDDMQGAGWGGDVDCFLRDWKP